MASSDEPPDRDRDPDERDFGDQEDEELAADPVVHVDISGLSIFTHHGVGQAEREVGQRLVFDISFSLEECDAIVTDRLEDTVDYGDVCQQVALAAQERSFNTLERLCSHVAGRLLDRYGVEQVTVRAAKPEPPIALPVDEVAVEVLRERAD
jgi:7,8-dihydroneopterin aldolase/epimerase/oxygenase